MLPVGALRYVLRSVEPRVPPSVITLDFNELEKPRVRVACKGGYGVIAGRRYIQSPPIRAELDARNTLQAVDPGRIVENRFQEGQLAGAGVALEGNQRSVRRCVQVHAVGTSGNSASYLGQSGDALLFTVNHLY